MPTITFKHISEAAVIKPADYEWLKERLNKPLQLCSIDYGRDGNILSVTVYKSESIICIFFYCGKCKYTLKNTQPKRLKRR